MIRYKFRCSL